MYRDSYPRTQDQAFYVPNLLPPFGSRTRPLQTFLYSLLLYDTLVTRISLGLLEGVSGTTFWFLSSYLECPRWSTESPLISVHTTSLLFLHYGSRRLIMKVPKVRINLGAFNEKKNVLFSLDRCVVFDFKIKFGHVFLIVLRLSIGRGEHNTVKRDSYRKEGRTKTSSFGATT